MTTLLPPRMRRADADADGVTMMLRKEELPHGGDMVKMLAAELNSMSMQERDSVFHDLHGVSSTIEETRELRIAKCQELECHVLKLIQQQSKQHQQQQVVVGNNNNNNNNNSVTALALGLAFHQNMNYVRSLYMTFLRRSGFNCVVAADTMVKHYQHKRYLFGEHTLGRDITLNDDFDLDDWMAINHCAIQFIPNRRDRAGRPVFVWIFYEQTYKEPKILGRIWWYLYMRVLKDEETQQKGIVCISYNLVPRPVWRDKFNPIAMQEVSDLDAAVPIKVAALHHCFTDPSYGAILAFFSAIADRETWTRTRLHHHESHMECVYNLMSYGIPTEFLPVTSDGKIRTKAFLEWLQAQKADEKKKPPGNITTTNATIIIPSNSDVIFGKGKPVRCHPGNLRLGHLIEEKYNHYSSTTKQHIKQEIKYEIFMEITKQGGRFIKQNKDGIWYQVDEKTAIEKVAHGIRNRKPCKATEAEFHNNNNNNNSQYKRVEKRSTPDYPTNDATTFEGTAFDESNNHRGCCQSPATIFGNKRFWPQQDEQSL